MKVNEKKMNSIHVDRLETNIPGLKYRPSIYDNNLDEYSGYDENHDCTLHPFQDFSPRNQQKLFKYFKSVKKKCKCIVEIGICQHINYFRTSSCILIDNKLPETVYIGIDIENRSTLHNKGENVHTITTDSRKKEKLWNLMDSLGLEYIDFLFIDGDHSLNLVLNDYSYVEKLAPEGIVGFHDTTWHVGPYFTFEALDENVYDKRKYFDDIQGDWGIAFALKK